MIKNIVFFLNIFFFGFINFYSNAQADGPSPTPTPTDSARKVDCSQFCQQFVSTENTNGLSEATGLLSSSPWNTSDDVLCSELGQSTTQQTTQKPAPDPSFAASTSCSIPVTPNVLNQITNNPSAAGITAEKDDDDYGAQVCIAAGKLKDRCLYHISQVEPQCLAYEALVSESNNNTQSMNHAQNIDRLLLSLDFGVAAICALACTSLNPALLTTCSLAATGEGVTELALTLQAQTSPVAQAIGTYKQTLGFDYTSLVGGILGTAGGVTLGAHQLEETKKRNKYLACGTAAVFTVLGGVRTASLIAMSQTAEKACETINNLFTTPTLKGNILSTTTAGGSSLGSANTSVTKNPASSGNTGTAIVKEDQLSTFLNCVRANPQSSTDACAQTAGITLNQGKAVDRTLLTPKENSGSFLNPIQNLDNFVKKATDEGAGSALGSILPSSTGTLGPALSNLANSAQKEAGSLSGPLQMQSVYSGGGNSGNARKSNNSGIDNPFASIFGGTGTEGGSSVGKNTQTVTFSEAVNPSDIWHSNSNKSLFQIISYKLSKVSNRMGE